MNKYAAQRKMSAILVLGGLGYFYCGQTL